MCVCAAKVSQCPCISRTFRDQREALRRGEARAAIAAAVPVQLAAAIEAVLWTTETRESYGRATRRIVFALRRNDQLRRRVLDGSLTPTALAALDEEALAPPAVAQRRADDRSRLAKRVGARPSTLPEVDAFECPRCARGVPTWPTRRTGARWIARTSLRGVWSAGGGGRRNTRLVVLQKHIQ